LTTAFMPLKIYRHPGEHLQINGVMFTCTGLGHIC